MKSSARGSFRRLLLGSIFLPLWGAGAQSQEPKPQPVAAPEAEIVILSAQPSQPPSAQPNASQPGQEIVILTAQQAQPPGAQTSPSQNSDQKDQKNNQQNNQLKKAGEAAARFTAVTDLDMDGTLDFQAVKQGNTGTLLYVRTPVENLLGANMTPPDGAVRAQLGIPIDRGLVVTSIVNEGPAAKIGLAANDIILMVAEKPVANMGDIAEALKAAPEKVVNLKLLRAGKEQVLNVRSVPRVTWAPATEKPVGFFIGVSAAPIEETLQVHLGLPKNQGLLAKEIVAESPAEKCGIKTNDILIEVNGVALDQADTLQKTVQESQGQPVKFRVIRAGKPLNVQVTPEARVRDTDAATATFMLVGQERAFQNNAHGVWAEVASGLTTLNGATGQAQKQFDPAKGIHFLPFVETIYDPTLAAAYVQGLKVNVPLDPTQSLTARIDRLEAEIKAIKAAVESIRDALKK